MVSPSLKLLESLTTTTPRGTELHKPITFSMVTSNLEVPAFYSFILHCVLDDMRKNPNMSLPSLWSPRVLQPSRISGSFLVLPALPSPCLMPSPMGSAAPLPAGSGIFTPPGFSHHSPSFPCHRPDSMSFYHSPSI